MARLLVPALAVFLAACGAVSVLTDDAPDRDQPPHPVGAAPWTIDDPPVPDPPLRRSVEVVEDVDLGLTVDDSVRWGAENGDWEHELSGRLLRVWSTYRPDYLDRVTASLDLDFSTDPPSVVGGAITYMNSTSEPVTQFVERGTLELQSADMSGVVAGRWTGPYGDELVFWVDVAVPSS